MAFEMPSFGEWKPAWEQPQPKQLTTAKATQKIIPRVKTVQVISDYLTDLLDTRRLRIVIERAEMALRKYDFDAIAYRGMSGALFAVPLALHLGKNLIMVRKKGDGSHSIYHIEGAVDSQRYIIADDFVSSGYTAAKIVKELTSRGNMGECIGVIEARKLMRHETHIVSPLDIELTPTPTWETWYERLPEENDVSKDLSQNT